MKTELIDIQPVNEDYLINNLREIVERCMNHKLPVYETEPETGIRKRKKDKWGRYLFTFDGATAIRALEMLGKHIGFFGKDNTQRNPEQPRQMSDNQFAELMRVATKTGKRTPNSTVYELPTNGTPTEPNETE